MRFITQTTDFSDYNPQTTDLIIVAYHFHRVCIGLKATAKPSFWICVSCRKIARTVKLLSETAGEHEYLIDALRKENDTLTHVINEQRTEIEKLQLQLEDINRVYTTTNSSQELATLVVPTYASVTTTPTSENTPVADIPSRSSSSSEETNAESRSGTLLIGDSILRDINKRGLEGTSVECIRGGTVQDIQRKLQSTDVNKYESLIIHVGTNDCTSDGDQKRASDQYRAMIDDLNTRAPAAQKVISTICPRTDNRKHQERVERLNSTLRQIAVEKGCSLVDNGKKFKKKDNNQPDSTTLDQKGLHLSKAGTRRLLQGINDVHRVIPVRNNAQKTQTRPTHGNAPRHSRASHSPRTRYSAYGKPQAMGNRRNSNNDRAQAYSGCYFCGGRNHNFRNCRYSGPVECFTCGSYGHLSYHCKDFRE